MTPSRPHPSQQAKLTRAMRHLRAFVAEVHEDGPMGVGWEASEVFALGPNDADEAIALVTAAADALERLT
jgi:hypothetical protein